MEVELRPQRQRRQAAERRTTAKEKAGFRSSPNRAAGRLPLPNRIRISPTTPPPQPIDGVRNALENDQFEAILDPMATHRDSVERNPGAGAPSTASEEHHRDQVLASLGQRFGASGIAVRDQMKR